MGAAKKVGIPKTPSTPLLRIKKDQPLKVESLVGRKFRDFAIFFADRESLYPPNCTFMKIREILLEKTPKMVLK